MTLLPLPAGFLDEPPIRDALDGIRKMGRNARATGHRSEIEAHPDGSVVSTTWADGIVVRLTVDPAGVVGCEVRSMGDGSAR